MKRGIQALVFLLLSCAQAHAATLEEYATEETQTDQAPSVEDLSFEPSLETFESETPASKPEPKIPAVLEPVCSGHKMFAAKTCGIPWWPNANSKECHGAILKMWTGCPWERLCLKEEDRDPYSAIYELITVLCKKDNSTDSTTTCGQLRHFELACAGLTSDLSVDTSAVKELTKKQAAGL